LKGNESFWKPFLDYLPASNETLFTISDDQFAAESVLLLSEIQRAEDDIFHKINYDRKINEDSRKRFEAFIAAHLVTLNEWQGTDLSVEEIMAHWEWAWMNLSTRCFGHHHLPNDIAMCPLLDLINHAQEQTKVRFFLYPWQIN